MLVVGYGSDLRGDDAAGRRVADALAERALPGVEVRSLHQLGPEIVEDFAGRRLVVLVDAAVDAAEVTVTTIEPSPAAGPVTHALAPGALLALAGRLGHLPGRVVAVRVPAHDLSLGTALSGATREAMTAATADVIALCGQA